MPPLKDRLVDNPITNRTVMRRIITAVDAQNPPEDFRQAKVLFFIGGGRASGKTTINNYLFDLLAEQGISEDYVGKLGSYAFADVLDKPVMQRMRHTVNKFLDKSTKGEESDKGAGGLGGQLLDHAIDTIFAQGSPAVVDNHMDNPAFVDRILEKAKAHGYETVMVSPHISPETYFAREEKRFAETGRPYHTKSGLAKHAGFAAGLPHYEEAFDMTLLLDNDSHGKAPTPISYSVAGEVTVLDEEKYHAAQRKTDINIDARDAGDVWHHNGQRRDAPSAEPRPETLGESPAPHRAGREAASGARGMKQPQGEWSQRILEHYTGPQTGHQR